MKKWDILKRQSVIECTCECNTFQYPIFLFFLCGSVNCNDKVGGVSCRRESTSSDCCFVDRHFIIFNSGASTIFCWDKFDDRWLSVHYSWTTVFENTLVYVKLTAFNEQTMYIGTLIWGLYYEFGFNKFSEFEGEAENVNCYVILSWEVLKDRSQETLRKEECG